LATLLKIYSMNRFIIKTKIEKGWSGDSKYHVVDQSGKHYLLRVSSADTYDSKLSEFNMMKQMEALNIPMCLPIEIGTCDEGVYSLQSWIDGEDAEEVIPTLTKAEQYNFGYKAGEILKTIHTIKAPDDVIDWEIRFNKKIDRKIKGYTECPLKYENGELFIDFVNKNRYLLKNRPQVYQHGDYHIGNMMIDNSGHLMIIDFQRNDFGDPWEEFNRIVWSAQASPYFASGIVDGYFQNDVPLDFWKLLALYISSNTLSSLYWALPFGESEITTMRNQAKEVLEWYDNMKNPIPIWYKHP